MGLGPSGSLEGSTDQMTFSFDFIVDDYDHHIYLQEFKVTSYGDMVLKLRGNSLIDWFSNVIIDAVSIRGEMIYAIVDGGTFIDDVSIRNQIRGRKPFVVAVVLLNFLSGVFTATFLRCGTVEIVMETTIKTLRTTSCYQNITIFLLHSLHRCSKGQWPISYRTASDTSFKKPSTKWTENASPTITKTRRSKRFCRASWHS